MFLVWVVIALLVVNIIWCVVSHLRANDTAGHIDINIRTIIINVLLSVILLIDGVLLTTHHLR